MIPAKLAGAVILGVLLVVLAWAALRRRQPILWFALALIPVGRGYLMATGRHRRHRPQCRAGPCAAARGIETRPTREILT
jgi:hypothetical protein